MDLETEWNRFTACVGLLQRSEIVHVRLLASGDPQWMAVDDSFYSFYGIPGNKKFIFSFGVAWGVAQDFFGVAEATPCHPGRTATDARNWYILTGCCLSFAIYSRREIDKSNVAAGQRTNHFSHDRSLFGRWSINSVDNGVVWRYVCECVSLTVTDVAMVGRCYNRPIPPAVETPSDKIIKVPAVTLRSVWDSG